MISLELTNLILKGKKPKLNMKLEREESMKWNLMKRKEKEPPK